MVTQCLLKTRFTRWIDAFSYDDWTGTKLNGMRIGRNDGKVLFLYWNRHNTLTYFDGFRKMCRGGSAAAADNPSAFHYNIEHLFCEFFRIYIIYGLSVYIFGQTCIWIHNNRRGAAGCQLFHKRFHLCWTKSAVKADSIYAKPLQQCYCRRNISACQQFCIFIKGHGNKYR